MDVEDYSSCWFCDNIVNHPEQIGLLHLDFPRCFVLVPNSYEFNMGSYEDFENEFCKIHWLDPSEKTSQEEKKKVLLRLWNFLVMQERVEEDLECDREFDEKLYGDIL